MTGGWFLALVVAVAGGVGTTARHLVDTRASARLGEGQPWGIFAVNVSGSLALGLVVGFAPGDVWIEALGIGLLGGYTTFSTAMLQTIQGVQEGRSSRVALLAAAMVIACVAAAALGMLLGSLPTGVGAGR